MGRRVRFHSIEEYHGKRGTTYAVRWCVGKRRFRETHPDRPAAAARLAELEAQHRAGEPFDTTTGRPDSLAKPNTTALSWFAFACGYIDVKWALASQHHRRGIADALVDITEVLAESESADAPPRHRLRLALRQWAYAGRCRGDRLARRHAEAIAWLQQHSTDLNRFAVKRTSAAETRRILQRLSVSVDGDPVAANTFRRKRAVLFNAFEYARERDLPDTNPLQWVNWTAPICNDIVDPVVVPNPDQARRLLDAIGRQGDLGQRLVAFFACIYYAGLRPEEVTAVRTDNLLALPRRGWGQFHLTAAEPEPGRAWTNTNTARAIRPLKHRAHNATRIVPIHPELAAILRHHQMAFPNHHGTRLITGPRGGVPTARTYLRIWHAARDQALTDPENAIGLAATPYHLRHACLSTWLAAGVEPTQIAAWAGNSIATLQRSYTGILHNNHTQAQHRILAATTPRPRRRIRPMHSASANYRRRRPPRPRTLASGFTASRPNHPRPATTLPQPRTWARIGPAPPETRAHTETMPG